MLFVLDGAKALHAAVHRRAGDMRLRWAAAGILCAEDQYHRVEGHRQLAATLALQTIIHQQLAKTA